MPAALQQHDPDLLLRSMPYLAQALHGLGVTVRFTELRADVIGDWYGHNQTAIIRVDAHPRNQAWFLWQVLALLTVGPDGSPAARRQSQLRLVPSPRPSTD